VAPLGISSVPAKQSGKKHGKGTVNLGDGFAKVAWNSGGDSVVVKKVYFSTGDFGDSSTISCAFKEDRRRKLTT
jgi:hypothetical protein